MLSQSNLSRKGGGGNRGDSCNATLCGVVRWQCREAVWVIVPGAAVILYGSRARGDARTDSDYDLLVLVDGEVDWKLEDQIRQCLYPLELATGAVLTVHAYSRM